MLKNYREDVQKAGVLAIDIETSTSNPAILPKSKKSVKEIYPHPPLYKLNRLPSTGIASSYLAELGSDYGLSVAAPVVVISLAWADQTYLIEDPYPGGKGWEDLLTLKKWADELDIVWVAHNAIFDFRALGIQFDIIPKKVWCTLVHARYISFQLQEYNLLAVADHYNIPVPPFMRQAKKKRTDIMEFRKTKEFNEYAREDAKLTLAIYNAQNDFINKRVEAGKPFLRRYSEMESKAFSAYLKMCVDGIPISVERAEAEVVRLNEIINYTGQVLMERYGLENPASSQQAVIFLYTTLGIPKPDPEVDESFFFTSGGALSASTDVVTVLATLYKDDKRVREPLLNLAHYRLALRKRDLVKTLLAHAFIDGRIHSMIVPATVTGRRASSQPNLQNIQMVVEDNKIYEPIGGMSFLWQPTFCFYEHDVNRAELNMAAALAADNKMAEACAAGDMHSAMAEVYFGDVFKLSEGKERKHLRSISKNVTFAYNYGSGAKKIAETINLTNEKNGNPNRVTPEQIQEMLDAFTRTFNKLAGVKNQVIGEAERRGFVNLWTGRPVYIDTNRAFTTSWNALCQGGVAEIVKMLLYKLNEAFESGGYRARVVLEIHDSLIIDCPPEEIFPLQDVVDQVLQAIVPESLKTKTNPPIKWKMGCSFDENDYKWGANNSDRPPSQKA